MKHAQENGDYLVVPNTITGRLEVYLEKEAGEQLVASMPGDSTQRQITELCNRLRKEVK